MWWYSDWSGAAWGAVTLQICEDRTACRSKANQPSPPVHEARAGRNSAWPEGGEVRGEANKRWPRRKLVSSSCAYIRLGETAYRLQPGHDRIHSEDTKDNWQAASCFSFIQRCSVIAFSHLASWPIGSRQDQTPETHLPIPIAQEKSRLHHQGVNEKQGKRKASPDLQTGPLESSLGTREPTSWVAVLGPAWSHRLVHR